MWLYMCLFDSKYPEFPYPERRKTLTPRVSPLACKTNLVNISKSYKEEGRQKNVWLIGTADILFIWKNKKIEKQIYIINLKRRRYSKILSIPIFSSFGLSKHPVMSFRFQNCVKNHSDSDMFFKNKQGSYTDGN